MRLPGSAVREPSEQLALESGDLGGAISSHEHVTNVTRRRLIDGLASLKACWSGRLEEAEFLGRLYDIDALPSRDSRFSTAAQDICQHRWLNDDWDDDWIFLDTRFDVGSTDVGLLEFLAEGLHPTVRPDTEEVGKLLELYNGVLRYDGYEIVQIDAISGAPVYGWHRIGEGVPGQPKNLIFAANGPKPEIVLPDAVNNDIRIVKNSEYCLVYERPIPPEGLTFAKLITWWREREELADQDDRTVGLALRDRLSASLGTNDAERLLFDVYQFRYGRDGFAIPALIPQVYLHYDPYTRRQRGGQRVLKQQRMDFLLLFPHRVRVVIECDGRQHYARPDGSASPDLYAEMVAEDREVRLRGYEVFRFGGAELVNRAMAIPMIENFFERLAQRYSG